MPNYKIRRFTILRCFNNRKKKVSNEYRIVIRDIVSNHRL